MISVITGAPGAGKSTYADLNSKPGDVIIDLDKIATALWKPTTDESHSYPDHVRMIARYARNSAVNAAIQISQVTPNIHVWVIHAAPSREMRAKYRAAGAQFIALEPGMDVCIERVRKRNPTAHSKIVPFIRDFYAARVRD